LASNAGMSSSNYAAEPSSPSAPLSATALEERLINLEVKLSFTEDLVEHLNDLVARQQVQIQWLAEQLRALRQQPSGEPAGFRSLRDELPPHY
jgi:SlyX protein